MDLPKMDEALFNLGSVKFTVYETDLLLELIINSEMNRKATIAGKRKKWLNIERGFNADPNVTVS